MKDPQSESRHGWCQAEERRRRRNGLTEYVPRWQSLQPTATVLFGSVGRGADRIESDLDRVRRGLTRRDCAWRTPTQAL